MSKGVFNLLHEKWILASDSQNTLGSFSILEIFERAHELKSLSGNYHTGYSYIASASICTTYSVLQIFAKW